MDDVGAQLAGAFVARCSARSLTPDTRLRILADGLVSSPSTDDDESLGRLHERLVSSVEQRARGAWYTPAWLADDIVARSVSTPGQVADPSCGGGVFLLAAAERLRVLGAKPEVIVNELLWGADVDPLAVAVTEAELWLWSAAHGAPTVAGPRLVVGDVLVDLSIPSVDVVVGNPPFLGQLKSATSVDADRRRALTARWGDAVRPYTDASWIFLLAAVEAACDGGTVSLVLPQSVLGARDAAVVRARVDRRAELVDCWVDDGKTFAAAVDVCVPTLRLDPTGTGAANDWLGPLGRASGTPMVAIGGSTQVLGDVATVYAGFRDEYYGLVDAVSEGGEGPSLITSGSIDPFRLRNEPVRFAKQRWHSPVVDITKASGRAARWVEVQAGPKLVVASQTRVLEGVVDADGATVAGVPALVIRPDEVDDLWLLAAAVHAPVVSAWMMQRTIGTALSSDACRPTSDLVSRIPLPTHRVEWERAASLGRDLASGHECWGEFATVADAAYGVDDSELRNWWLGRIPLR
ncbi:HsdM family class I SAM-dependent methyltransferase [Actinospongicola halichondriae]|uniref:HsdM family class I SAM-dependent methyltransferase n=1 Tax=Actinospongicola halichondriae TaxID=3236844 RepID=UPI003D3F6491